MSENSPASIYETQLVSAIFEPLARILIERARPKPGEDVLDAACGTGIVARLVAPMVGPSAPGHALLFQALEAIIGAERARPVAWSLADEAQLLELVSKAGFVSITTATISLQTKYPSARAFVEILLKGSSKVTREELAQIPADRKAAFINEVGMRLREYETSNALTLPMETRVLVGNRR
jgi:hypothetical protein